MYKLLWVVNCFSSYSDVSMFAYYDFDTCQYNLDLLPETAIKCCDCSIYNLGDDIIDMFLAKFRLSSRYLYSDETTGIDYFGYKLNEINDVCTYVCLSNISSNLVMEVNAVFNGMHYYHEKGSFKIYNFCQYKGKFYIEVPCTFTVAKVLISDKSFRESILSRLRYDICTQNGNMLISSLKGAVRL